MLMHGTTPACPDRSEIDENLPSEIDSTMFYQSAFFARDLAENA